MARPESLTVVVIVTLLVAFGAISTDLYLPSLPSIAAHFGASTGEAQLTLSAFLFGFAVSQLIYGPLSDRFGRRPVLIAGLALYALASLACMLAASMPLLIAARALQAVGACAGVVLGRAIVRDVYGRERAAKVLSYIGMAMALAPALGPILGGLIQTWFGWRANFLVLVAFGGVTLVAVLALLPETNIWRDPAMRVAQLGANYRTLARDRGYLGFVLVCAFAYAGIFTFISGSSFLLIGVLGLSPEQFGLSFAAIVVGYMIGTLASARLTLRVGLERLIFAGTLFALCGGGAAMLLSFLGIVTIASVVAPVFVFLIGTGLMMPNALAGAIGPHPTMAGAASALLGFVQMVIAGGVGIAVGHFHDGSGRAMALALAANALGAFLAYSLLARTASTASLEQDAAE